MDKIGVSSTNHPIMRRSRKRGAAAAPAFVSVLIGDLGNVYFSEMAAGIMNVADGRRILVNISANQNNPDFHADYCRWIVRSNCSGIIIANPDAYSSGEIRRLIADLKLPVVAINPPSTDSGIPSIRICYDRAMEMVVQHALKYGHTRIGMLNNSVHTYSAIEKKKGVEAALKRASLTLLPELYAEEPGTMEGGFQGMKRLLELKPEQRPSAVATANDMMALGAMHAIRSRGLSIPGDMTVIGFDDIAMAAHANPPLTTISPPKFEIGAWAMRKILDQIKNDARDGKDYSIMESPLVVRESSGPYGG